jgi:hypothetical protein
MYSAYWRAATNATNAERETAMATKEAQETIVGKMKK